MNGTPRFLIIGDSFSQDLYNIIRETGAFPGFQIAAIYLPARCQLYLDFENASDFQNNSDLALCATKGNFLSKKNVSLAQEADVVVFAASWLDWAAERFPLTLEAFSFRPEQEIFVVGTMSFGTISYRGLMKYRKEDLPALRNTPEPRSLVANKTLKHLLPAKIFIDLWPLICDGPESCAPFTPSGELMSPDGTQLTSFGSHLAPAGARYLGRLLFSRPPLNKYLMPPAAPYGSSFKVPRS